MIFPPPPPSLSLREARLMARCSAPLLAVARAYASTVGPPGTPLCAARVSLRLRGACLSASAPAPLPAPLPLFASVGCVAHAAAPGGRRTILLQATW
jgi:hypothetical protein